MYMFSPSPTQTSAQLTQLIAFLLKGNGTAGIHCVAAYGFIYPDHREDMRMWDGKSALNLEAQAYMYDQRGPASGQAEEQDNPVTGLCGFCGHIRPTGM